MNLAQLLRCGTRGGGDPLANAAVELLINHIKWLRRGDFVADFVRISDTEDTAYIDFHAIADALEERDHPTLRKASSSERGILSLAVDLATNRWHLTGMNPANRALVRTAVAAATGAT